MTQVSSLLSISFILTTFLALLLFMWVLRSSSSKWTYTFAPRIIIVLLAWLILQSALSWFGVYSTNLDALPPRMAIFGILPTFAVMIVLFISKKGRIFIDSLPLEQVTYLNIVRIPVELVLFGLAVENTIPELLTFAGSNYDILAGITAPLIAYFGFRKRKIAPLRILQWNIISLILLLTVVFLGLFSAPFPLQKFAFDQPNWGMLYFPFSWLPTFVVPLVLFGHFVSIRKLILKKAFQ